MHGDGDLARLPLDVDVGDRRVREPRLEILADQLIFLEELGEVAPCEVTGTPLLDDPESEPIGVCFLAHLLSLFLRGLRPGGRALRLGALALLGRRAARA